MNKADVDAEMFRGIAAASATPSIADLATMTDDELKTIIQEATASMPVDDEWTGVEVPEAVVKFRGAVLDEMVRRDRLGHRE